MTGAGGTSGARPGASANGGRPRLGARATAAPDTTRSPDSGTPDAAPDPVWARERTAVLRDSVGVGLAVGALGLSFGALAAVTGFTTAQACVLSLLMFSGASQFAVIGVLGSGGSPLAGAATAGLLGVRNGLYGIALSPLLRVRGGRRLIASHLVLDESAGMATGRASERAGRLAFWATGIAVFVCWNLATLIGAVGVNALPDPEALGLDVAAPAAFVALLIPRLRGLRLWMIALAAAAVALVTTLFTPAGVPVLLAGLVAGVAGLVGHRRATGAARLAFTADEDGPSEPGGDHGGVPPDPAARADREGRGER